MQQFVTGHNLLIKGKSSEVAEQLKKLSEKFKTVKELLEFYTKTL
ncbi:MAG: hypothetical protein N3I35_08830 [Clostridia bacterium]|nr:hypothetical protein [Clostridia bacterium]